MLKVKVYLKSGHTVVVKCESCTFQFDKETFDYVGYEFHGHRLKNIGLVPSQIAGYTVTE